MSLLLLLRSLASRIPSGAAGPALGDVLIAAHGDRGRRPLQCAGIRVSSGVNEAGEFSAFARLSDALAIAADPADLRGMWLTWDRHPTLPPFGGPITDVAVRSSQTLELAARGWLALLDKRLTRRRDRQVIAHAGPIAARLVRDAGAVHPTGITGTDSDEWGEFVSWRDDGGEVLSALSRLSSMSDQDYGVDETTRTFIWRRRWGSDNRETVQLVQGYHIAEWRPAYALAPVITEVVLSPSDRSRFARTPSVAGHDADAYAQFGPRQARGTFRGNLRRSSAQAVATKQAERFARRGHLIELDVVDADGCWARIRRGDTITVIIADLDAALVVRCLLLSWDQDSNLLRVTGEIVS